MLRRMATAAVLAALTLVWSSPAQAGTGADVTIAKMTAHYQDRTLEVQHKPFALLYLRTTEGMRAANAEGEFSDPAFWDSAVIPTFAAYYLDAYAAWRRGDEEHVPPAWRISFQAHADRLTCTQLIYLGINAHVNNDLAFVIDDLGPRYTYADHKHVDDVLAYRVGPVVYPEIQRDLCPDLFADPVPATADRDIDAWRQLAWENAQRLRHAPDAKSRRVLAKQIRRHARDKAHEILRWNR